MSEYIKLLRVHQWIKNLFIFVPAFFDQGLFQQSCFSYSLAGFFAFSFVASAVYILNDYRDLSDDRKHPRKKNRPLASGAVPVSHAFVMFGLLVVSGTFVSLTLTPYFTAILLLYIVINVFYSLGLKHVPIIDISIVALGFVLRIFSGGVICNIDISAWLIVITFLFALFVALAKRRDDVLIFLESGQKTRKVIDGYNTDFLNIAMGVMASVVIVAYLMYTLSERIIIEMNTEYMYLTVFFVILGILRYLQRAFVEEDTGSPTEIVYDDRFIQLTVIAWLGTVALLLYI